MAKIKPIAVKFTDLHIEDGALEVCRGIALQAIGLAVKLGVKYIINGGDSFNSRKSQSLNCLILMREILDECERNGLVMIAIDGNHDKLMYNSEHSYMDVYSNHPALKLVKRIALFSDIADGLTVSFASFFSDDNQCSSNANYVANIKELSDMASSFKDRVNICVTHHGVDGAKANDGAAVESDISRKLFEAFDMTLIGHYHDEVMLGKKIHYVGSCRQAWYNETNDKGFVVINSDGSYERVRSEFKEYVEETIHLIGEYNAKIEAAMNILDKEHPNDFKRLHLTGDKADLRTIDVTAIKARGFDVRTTDKTAPVTQGAEEFNYIQFDKSKMAGIFMEFMDEEGIVEDAEMEYGLEVLGRTLNNNNG